MDTVIKKRKIYTAEDIVIAIFCYSFLALLAVICLIPFMYVLSLSLTSDDALMTGSIKLIPADFSLNAYKTVFNMGGGYIVDSFFNSIYITLAGTALSLFIMVGFAYPLSKPNLPGRKYIMWYVMFAMLIGGGFIPGLLLIRNWLRWSNTYAALIIPGAYSAYNMIIMRNFFMGVPESLQESALLDGASEIQTLYKVVLPLSLPVIATIGLFTAVGYWNSWMPALLYVKQEKYPLMMVLMNIMQSVNGTDFGGGSTAIVPSRQMQMAVVVIVALPIFMVYPFLQKHFASGMLLGSVKG